MRKYKTKTKIGLPKKACIRNTSLVHYRVFLIHISHQKMKGGKTEVNQAVKWCKHANAASVTLQ